MGIRDWFKKKDDEPQSRKVKGAWTFTQGNTNLTISDFTDTGVSYRDRIDGVIPMKLYTFKMYKDKSDTISLGKMYEEVAFEAPAEWDIEAAINNGMLLTLLSQTNAINRSFNDNGRQIDVLGRFDSNSNFTYSVPGIQEYVDNTYVPELNQRIENLRRAERQKMEKENNPGFLINALGKVMDFFDGIKERRNARKETKLLAAAQKQLAHQPPRLSREEKGLSSNEIRPSGRDGFRIGNSRDENVMAVDIIGEPQMLEDGSYLYTAKRQLTRTFEHYAELTSVPNCQFSFPVPPEQFQDFLMACENPKNEFAKSNADALMYLLNQNPLPGRGLYIGGLFVGNDGNLHYDECHHMQDSINRLNRSDKLPQQQYPQSEQTYEM